MLITYIDSIEFELNKETVESICTVGSNDFAVGQAIKESYIKEQLSKIDTEKLRNSVSNYGVEDTENMSRNDLEEYFVWIGGMEYF